MKTIRFGFFLGLAASLWSGCSAPDPGEVGLAPPFGPRSPVEGLDGPVLGLT